jgi:hypothetical protein
MSRFCLHKSLPYLSISCRSSFFVCLLINLERILYMHNRLCFISLFCVLSLVLCYYHNLLLNLNKEN